MKINKIIVGFLIASMAIFTACEKDAGISPNGNATAQKNTVGNNDKSAESDFESMAKAANVESITYSSGVYTISIYGSSTTYDVTVNSFDYESVIDFDIEKSTGGESNIHIDSTIQTIIIEDIGTYSFADFKEFEIIPTNDVIFNLTPIISIFHAITPMTSATFDDNWNGDVFPDGDRRFWGWGSGVPGPCEDNQVVTHYTYYVFWIGVGGRNSDPNLC